MKVLRLEYNNNLFSFSGRINRLFYILQNFIVNTLGFRFIYYPAMVSSFQTLQNDPALKELINFLSTTSLYGPLIKSLSAQPPPSMMIIVIKFLFFIPLRFMDLKRIKDIINRELSLVESAIVAIILTMPYVDFFSTIALSIIPANKYAKNELTQDIKEKNLNEANKEKFLELNKRLFAEGKISKADYLKTLDKYKS